MTQPLLFDQKRPPHLVTPRARYADCPGEDCHLPRIGIPIASAPDPWRFYPHDPDGDKPARLFCPACGLGWHGTDEEVELSTRKEAAYQRRAIREGR